MVAHTEDPLGAKFLCIQLESQLPMQFECLSVVCYTNSWKGSRCVAGSIISSHYQSIKKVHISSKDVVSLNTCDTICEYGLLFLHLYILSKLILPVYWYRQTGSEICPTEILLGTPCSPALSQFKHKCVCNESALH